MSADPAFSKGQPAWVANTYECWDEVWITPAVMLNPAVQGQRPWCCLKGADGGDDLVRILHHSWLWQQSWVLRDGLDAEAIASLAPRTD